MIGNGLRCFKKLKIAVNDPFHRSVWQGLNPEGYSDHITWSFQAAAVGYHWVIPISYQHGLVPGIFLRACINNSISALRLGSNGIQVER